MSPSPFFFSSIGWAARALESLKERVLAESSRAAFRRLLALHSPSSPPCLIAHIRRLSVRWRERENEEGKGEISQRVEPDCIRFDSEEKSKHERARDRKKSMHRREKKKYEMKKKKCLTCPRPGCRSGSPRAKEHMSCRPGSGWQGGRKEREGGISARRKLPERKKGWASEPASEPRADKRARQQKARLCSSLSPLLPHLSFAAEGQRHLESKCRPQVEGGPVFVVSL